MARICQEVSKRLSKPHIIVSLCYSLAKKAKFNSKFTFKLKWSTVCQNYVNTVLINCFVKLHFSDFCGYGPFGPRRPKQLNGHIRKKKLSKGAYPSGGLAE